MKEFKIVKLASFIAILFLISIKVYCAVPIFNVTTLNNPSPGYIKFDWWNLTYFYLIDNYGCQVYADSNLNLRSNQYKLLSNGNWIQITVNKCYIYNQNLELLDSIPFPDNYIIDLHEVELLSNGHYMVILQERVIMDMSEIVDGGKTNAQIISNVLIETDRSGTIHWLWRALDHYDLLDATPNVDLTQQVIDFTHCNSFVECSDGNIILSTRHLDELTKINKSNGEIIWRMGGSMCKNNEFTFTNDSRNNFFGFSHQHSISVLSNGNILMYDNGNMKNPQYSRAVEYQVDEVNKTVTRVWEYRNNPDIYQPMMGSTYRLENGNTLINWGSQKITEVKPNNSIAFEIEYQSEFCVYRAYRYITRMNAVLKRISGNGSYNYNEGNNHTGVSINVSNLTGSGSTSIEKHYYEPPIANYLDSNYSRIYPYRWVFSKTGISQLAGTLKIKLDSLPEIQRPDKVSIYFRFKEASGTFAELPTTYNQSSNELIAPFTTLGEFVIGSNKLDVPILNSPRNNDSLLSITNTFVWSKIKGATKYHLQVSSTPNFSHFDIDDPALRSNELTYNNLHYNTKYYWRVRALNSKDTTNWSSVFSFSTESLAIPNLLHPENGARGIKEGDSLIWSKVEIAENYWLQLSKNANFSNIVFEEKKLTDQHFVLESIEYNTEYHWRVCAYRKNDTSFWSNFRFFTTTLSQPNLKTPMNNTVNLSLNGYLIWNPVNGAENYEIMLSNTSDFKTLLAHQTNLNSTVYEYKDLEYSKEYFWKVRSYNNTDTSAWSKVWTFATELEKPVLTSPANEAKDVTTLTEFKWNPPTKATSYSLQISKSEFFENVTLEVSDIKIAYYQAIELPSLTRLFWRLKHTMVRGKVVGHSILLLLQIPPFLCQLLGCLLQKIIPET